MAEHIEKAQRDSYIDVIKGIGIFSIVIGHASWDIQVDSNTIHIGAFVYLYHLAIFFFCTGYLYKDVVDDYWKFVAKKLRGLYRPFIIYSFLYMLCRNLFIDMGILQGDKYTGGMWLITFTNVLTFNSIAELLSAFWFLPVLFFAICFYAAINYLTRNFSSYFKHGGRVLCYLLIGIAGLFTVDQKYGLLYNLQISYLMVPVIALGHYFALYKEILKKIVNVFGLVISFAILVFVIESNVGIIELINFMIINKLLFYPVTLCGIWFCLCLGKVICRSSWLEKAFSIAGRMSLDIMALHFLSFKLVDYVACHVLGNTEFMNTFPHTFVRLWPVYYIVGMVIPICMKKLEERVITHVKGKIYSLISSYDKEIN